MPVVFHVANGRTVHGLYIPYNSSTPIGSLDPKPYWKTSSGDITLSELYYASKFRQDIIWFTGTLDKDITVYNEYGGKMTAKDGTSGYFTGDFEGVDPLNLQSHSGGTMNLSFTPPPYYYHYNSSIGDPSAP